MQTFSVAGDCKCIDIYSYKFGRDIYTLANRVQPETSFSGNKAMYRGSSDNTERKSRTSNKLLYILSSTAILFIVVFSVMSIFIGWNQSFIYDRGGEWWGDQEQFCPLNISIDLYCIENYIISSQLPANF